MIEFLVGATLIVAATLVLLLRPLWSRNRTGHAPDPLADLRAQLLQIDALREAGALDDSAHAEGRARLERRIVDIVASRAGTVAPATPQKRLTSGVLPLALGLALAIVAGGYAWLGTPEGMTAVSDTAVSDGGTVTASSVGPETAPHTMDTAQVRAMVDGLAQRLAKTPGDAAGWAMLARSWVVLEEPARALQAYRQALDAGVRDAALLADFADALAVTQGGRIEGEALQRVQEALAIDPDEPKALSLAGTAAFDRGDDAGAVRHWAHLQSVGPPDHPRVQQMKAGLDEARRRLAANSSGRETSSSSAMAVPANNASVTALGTEPASATEAFVAGTVRLAPALARQVRPDDTVFIFARAAQGPRMPLAVLRRQVKDLPLAFRLDDSMVMSPALKLSSQSQVVVGARISRSGQATPQPDEPRVESAMVNLGRRDVALTIAGGAP